MHHATLTTVIEFRAEHRYGRSDWTARENRAVFGEAMVAHAHDYRVEVTLRGQIDSETGFVTDLQALEKTLADFVVAPINDRAFHEAVDRFSGGGVQPSTEEIARWIWEVISPELSGPATLQSVRVHESDRLSVEYRGPGLHHPVP